MKFEFKKLDQHIQNIIQDIADLASMHGFQSYLVGGMVRDVLLGVASDDIDITTQDHGIQLAQLFAEKYEGKLTVHDRFQTASVALSNGLVVDFATTRKESYATSGQLPEVEMGTIQDDLYRRDFSINAMAVSLNKDSYGVIIDEYEGLKDLKAKQLRVLHKQSFLDDATRILRGVRYQARFNLQFEHNTFCQMKSAMANHIFDSLTPQRFFNEFKKNLSEANILGNIKALHELGVFDYLKINFYLSDDDINWLKAYQAHPQEGQEIWEPVWIFLIKEASHDNIERLAEHFSFSKKKLKLYLKGVHNE